MIVGTEWLVEAYGCDQDKLRNAPLMRATLEGVMSELGLTAVGSVWHKFPGEGGVTVMIALTESHLACHTYPEHGIATFNLYCCRTRPEWDWEANLKESLGASGVNITKIERGCDETSSPETISEIQVQLSLAGSSDSALFTSHSALPGGGN